MDDSLRVEIAGALGGNVQDFEFVEGDPENLVLVSIFASISRRLNPRRLRKRVATALGVIAARIGTPIVVVPALTDDQIQLQDSLRALLQNYLGECNVRLGVDRSYRLKTTISIGAIVSEQVKLKCVLEIERHLRGFSLPFGEVVFEEPLSPSGVPLSLWELLKAVKVAQPVEPASVVWKSVLGEPIVGRTLAYALDDLRRKKFVALSSGKLFVTLRGLAAIGRESGRQSSDAQRALALGRRTG